MQCQWCIDYHSKYRQRWLEGGEEMSEERIRLVIPGRPVPKQRPRLGIRGRSAYVYTPAETVAYEQMVRAVAMTVCRAPYAGPVELRLTVYFRKGRTPDLTNVVKAIEDGLTGVAYIDDAQVKRVVAEMDNDEFERAEVEVAPFEEAQTA